LAVLAGVAAGVALALWGAARTRFVRTADRLYYVPHTYTGIAVALLFVGRLAYRLLQVSGGTDQSNPAAALVRSPLTVGLYFALMGYYACYYSVVLWKSKRIKATDLGETAVSRPNDPTRA
jgi:cytochrome b561